MQYLKVTIFPLLILFVITSCQKNPATGVNEINLLSEGEEDSIGKNEHQKIVKQFGGEYIDRKLNNYIDSLGKFLVSTSELSEKKFKFTILNTPIVNAFALPGGYVYLTRGLIYLCQNEAQLAGVMAHEIGHITARHTAKRYTKTVGTSVFLQVLNVFSKNYFLNNLLGQSAQLYLLSFSRSQEFEADKLAVRYMARAGFDPQEMANFLKKMEEFSELQKKIFRMDNKVSELLQTHPNSSKRVEEVIDNYKGIIPLNPIIGKEIFLKKIDGILYGHKPEEGFFLKDTFVHKPLKIKFSFDQNFFFLNTPQALVGYSEKDSKIIFTLEENQKDNGINYLSKWLSIPKKKISNYKSFSNNGFSISYGEFIKDKKLFIVATLKGRQNLIYRFVLASNNDEIKLLKKTFEHIILTFNQISEEELTDLQPPTVKIVTASSDNNFTEKTKRTLKLQSKYAEEIFKVLNNLDNQIKVGKKIKTIY